MADVRFEIWFPSQDQASVFIETNATKLIDRELAEVELFAAFSARQIANLRFVGEARQELCKTLVATPHPAPGEEMLPGFRGVTIVSPSVRKGRRSFEGRVRLRGGVPLIKLKPRGFGLYQQIDYYAPMATLILLMYLLGRHSPEGRFLLVETARYIGVHGLSGTLTVKSQAQIAGEAITAALAELQKPHARADDPEEGYQLLFRSVRDLFAQRYDPSKPYGGVQYPGWFT